MLKSTEIKAITRGILGLYTPALELRAVITLELDGVGDMELLAVDIDLMSGVLVVFPGIAVVDILPSLGVTVNAREVWR
jgi:hypothetical protein